VCVRDITTRTRRRSHLEAMSVSGDEGCEQSLSNGHRRASMPPNTVIWLRKLPSRPLHIPYDYTLSFPHLFFLHVGLLSSHRACKPTGTIALFVICYSLFTDTALAGKAIKHPPVVVPACVSQRCWFEQYHSFESSRSRNQPLSVVPAYALTHRMDIRF
jgi:hypothetical protein